MWTYVIIGVVVVLVVLLCVALSIATSSFENYKHKLEKINNLPNSIGMTTLEYVGEINKSYFRGRLQVAQTKEYDDHYSGGVVALSPQTMYSNSLASLAIVSHELGHAKQDFTGNTLKKHFRMRRLGRFCGLFFMPLLIIGAVLSILGVFDILPRVVTLTSGLVLMGLSFLIFIFAIVLKYKEIKIEREASDFALDFLKDILNTKELKACKELLNSARLTYWASLIRTMLSWTRLTPKDTMFK